MKIPNPKYSRLTPSPSPSVTHSLQPRLASPRPPPRFLLRRSLRPAAITRGRVYSAATIEVEFIQLLRRCSLLFNFDLEIFTKLENYAKTEEAKVEELIKAVADSGAKVIVSGAAVGEMALHFCERYKIMVLKIGSKFELRRFCRTTGAVAMLKLGVVNPDDLGHVDSISVEEIGGARRGRSAEAEAEFGKLLGGLHVKSSMVELSKSNRGDEVDSLKLSELLYGRHFRVVFIGSALLALQQLSGINAVFYFSSTVFKSAGVPSDIANMFVGVVNLSVVAMVLMDKLGRKDLLLGSFMGMALSMTMQAVAGSTLVSEPSVVYLSVGGVPLN